MENSPRPVLSIVIPVYCEADVIGGTLAEVVRVVSSVTEDYEIIVVDDGSDDGSFECVVLFHQSEPRVKSLRLSRRFGKEAALMAGLAYARGDAVVTIDGDLQHPPVLIPQFVEKWRAGAQIVHGIKQDRHVDSFRHRMAARLFSAVFSRAAGFDMLGASDFKLLDRSVVRLLVKRFPEHTRFHRGLSTWVGFRQDYVPFTVQPRPVGKSRWSLYDLVRYAWHTVTAYTSLPLQVVPVLGFVMLAVSFVLGAETVISRLAGHAVSGFATLEITILFTGSLIMIGLGVIGQYLGRMYDELKRRPIYLVEDVLGFEGEESGR